jgi:hypothetical protein
MRHLARTLGGYEFAADSEPSFTAHDGVALGILMRASRFSDNRELAGHYQKCFAAVCSALKLDGTPFESRRMQPAALQNLLRLRAAMSRFCDEWGDYLEGDLWLREGRDPTRPQMAAAESWYRMERERCLQGVDVFDRAIFALLGWKDGERMPLARLRERFGYPSADSFDL